MPRNEHIFELLMKLKIAFINKRVRSIKKINDKFISLLVKEPNKDYLELSVLTYVLAKICTKPRFFTADKREHINDVIHALERMADEGISEKRLNEIKKAIMELEARDPRFVFDMFTKAYVKTAAILYAKGMSLGTASKLTGIPKQEILSYVGKTMMFDRVREEIDIRERLKYARIALLGRD